MSSLGWNASVARTDITSSAVFGADKAGVRAGVWAGAGVTRTAPSPTLFIAGIPRGVNKETVEALFKAEVGFIQARSVGRMLFCDYSSTSFALNAMRKHQGRAFPGSQDALLIDFDKDAGASQRAKRRREEQQQELEKRNAETVTPYFCMVCKSQLAFALSPIDGLVLKDMPRRGTDHAYVVEEAKFLRHHEMVPAGVPKLIKRDKGVETQYELSCAKCGLPLAYRPVPLAVATKYLYVLPDAVCWSQAARTPTERWVAEAGRASARAAAASSGSSSSSGGGERSGGPPAAPSSGHRGGRGGGGAHAHKEEEQLGEDDEEEGDYGYRPSSASSAASAAGQDTHSSGGGGGGVSSWPEALRARAAAALAGDSARSSSVAPAGPPEGAEAVGAGGEARDGVGPCDGQRQPALGRDDAHPPPPKRPREAIE